MVRRTAQQAAETRRELVDAAADVFAGCGFAGASLEQIAGLAGVTRGALYHHFDDKAAVYDAVLRREADEVMGRLMAGLAGEAPPLQRLHSFLVSYCSALVHDVSFRRAVHLLLFGAAGAPSQARDRTSRGYRAWLEAFEAVLVEARDSGALREGVSPRVAAGAVVVLAVGVTTTCLHARELCPSLEDTRSMADMLVAGLEA